MDLMGLNTTIQNTNFNLPIMKKFTVLILYILLTCNTQISKAQQNDTLEIQRDENGFVNFARFSLNST